MKQIKNNSDKQPIIGIISRDYFSETKKKINIVYNDIILSVRKSGGIPIGIPSNEDIMSYLEICDGFIFQGGDNINEHNLSIINILKERNIPTLGICLGMQEMFYEDNLVDVYNHQINSLHEVNIIKNTLLYRILKQDRILVNSRHKSALINKKYLINGKSNDNVIEALELSNHKFFLGVQWHPENLYNIDRNSKKIFDYFIKICKN